MKLKDLIKQSLKEGHSIIPSVRNVAYGSHNWFLPKSQKTPEQTALVIVLFDEIANSIPANVKMRILDKADSLKIWPKSKPLSVWWVHMCFEHFPSEIEKILNEDSM